jgi:hypothetical protein
VKGICPLELRRKRDEAPKTLHSAPCTLIPKPWDDDIFDKITRYRALESRVKVFNCRLMYHEISRS